jgi:hypothetical protein
VSKLEPSHPLQRNETQSVFRGNKLLDESDAHLLHSGPVGIDHRRSRHPGQDLSVEALKSASQVLGMVDAAIEQVPGINAHRIAEAKPSTDPSQTVRVARQLLSVNTVTSSCSEKSEEVAHVLRKWFDYVFVACRRNKAQYLQSKIGHHRQSSILAEERSPSAAPLDVLDKRTVHALLGSSRLSGTT